VTAGRFHWRGRVDGSDYIMLQGNQVSISHLEDKYIQDASYELPVPLPQQAVQARLTKLKGRGSVEIVRQPMADNEYTLTVLIQNPAGGDDLYEFEVTWWSTRLVTRTMDEIHFLRDLVIVSRCAAGSASASRCSRTCARFR
jgi:hypothetical protein